MTSKMEAASIRNSLSLRFNPNLGCYEVYSKIHGQPESKWIMLSDANAEWYSKQFNLILPAKRSNLQEEYF